MREQRFGFGAVGETAIDVGLHERAGGGAGLLGERSEGHRVQLLIVAGEDLGVEGPDVDGGVAGGGALELDEGGERGHRGGTP